MLLVLILAVLGFLNAYYLHYQYKQYVKSGKEMFCLFGGKCAEVISSRFGTTLGIKNEITGMIYYLLLSAYLLISMLIPKFGDDFALFAKIATIIATAFSVYLLFIQLVVLKQICSWCLIAIAINTLILYFL